MTLDTPPAAEAALQSLSDEMEIAAEGLAAARNEEVEAQHAYEAAKRRAQLSPDAPPVGVHGGIRVTVADKAAWVDDQVAREKFEWDIAKATRQAASTRLTMLRDQLSAAQSIASSVRTTYQGTGRWQ